MNVRWFCAMVWIASGCSAPATTLQRAETRVQVEPAGPACAASSAPECGQSALLWHGFRHNWLRTFAGFSIPHRVSRLDSYLAGEAHARTSGAWRGTADFHFGQNTGVDGNFMRPVGRYAAFHAPKSHVIRGVETFAWSDDATGEFPRAHEIKTAAIPLPEQAETGAVVAVLQGFELVTRCDSAKQAPERPCNSDGLWPYRFAVSFGQCAASSCPLRVEIGRAWTPNRGGLPTIAEKPFTQRLDLELRVHYALVAASHDDMALTRRAITHSGTTSDDPSTQRAEIVGAPGFAAGVVALSGFSFELQRTGSAESSHHLGRYISGLDFGVLESAYDGAAHAASVQTVSSVATPATVVSSDISYTLELVLLQFGPDAAIVPSKQVKGSICNNSNNAPFFSAWSECGSAEKGPERPRDRLRVEVRRID